MRSLPLIFALALAALPMMGAAQQVTSAPGAVLRVLDKTTGRINDVEISRGASVEAGRLTITMGDCRFPTGNPSGDAFAQMVILVRGAPEPAFNGWMVASAPALNAMDDPRYDVWVLRCTTS